MPDFTVYVNRITTEEYQYQVRANSYEEAIEKAKSGEGTLNVDGVQTISEEFDWNTVEVRDWSESPFFDSDKLNEDLALDDGFDWEE